MAISDKNTRTPLTINKELKKELEKLAKENNISFNKYVINILKEHINTLK